MVTIGVCQADKVVREQTKAHMTQGRLEGPPEDPLTQRKSAL